MPMGRGAAHRDANEARATNQHNGQRMGEHRKASRDHYDDDLIKSVNKCLKAQNTEAKHTETHTEIHPVMDSAVHGNVLCRALD